MPDFPWAFQQIEATTWAYVSSLLMLALFFKFSRVWSIRNLDLVLLVLLAPGLLLYNSGVLLERQSVAKLNELGMPVKLSLTSGGLLKSPSGPPETATDPTEPPLDDSNAPSTASDAAPPAGEDSTSAFTQQDGAGTTATAKDTETLSTLQDTDQANSNPGDEPADTLSHEPWQITDATSAPQSDTLTNGTTEDQKQWLDRRALSQSYLYWGFLCLLIVGVLFVIRLFLDQVLVRRPLIEANLTLGGLWLLVLSLLSFLVVNVTFSSPTQTDVSGARSAAEMLEGKSSSIPPADQEMGPAYPLLHVLPVIPTMMRDTTNRGNMNADQWRAHRSESLIWVAKLMAILSQLAIVAGLVWMGGYHFGNWQNGAAMATLYLMLPYTVQMAGAVDHVLPAALLLWAVLLYRTPFWSGLIFGMTIGLVYYPIFLLALWLSFYWERGVGRFLSGVGVAVVLLILSLVLFSTEEKGFVANLQAMFGVWLPRVSGLKGIWELGWDPWFRLPILVGFVSLGASMVAWPIRKTYGTLMAYSAALLVAVQFWHGYGGGLFMAWYLPLTIATIFRPGLHDRVAKTMIR